MSLKWRMATRVVLAAGIGTLLGGVVAGTAVAQNWNTTDNAYKAGGREVRFDSCDLMNNTEDGFHANDTHDIEPTVINTSLYHSCDTIDVRINDYDFGTNEPTGWYECHTFNSSQNCNTGHVHINTSYSDIPEDYQRTLRLVCEEIGHSVGLAHANDTDSCMSGSTAAHLTPHDKQMIDANY